MSWFHIMLESDDSWQEKNKDKKRIPTLGERFKAVLFRELLDIFFVLLSIFSYFYIFSLAALYLGGLWEKHFVWSFFIGALSEPYLGGVAVYTVLKEYRKKTRRFGSLHRGEIFVLLWLLLLMSSLFVTLISDEYVLNEPLHIIITNGIAVLLIYIGGVVHKP